MVELSFKLKQTAFVLFTYHLFNYYIYLKLNHLWYFHIIYDYVTCIKSLEPILVGHLFSLYDI